MDDHHPQYGVPELRQLMQGRTTTTESPSTSSHFPSDFFGFNLAPAAPPPPPQHHRLHQFTTDQEMGFLPRGIHGLGGSSSTAGNNSNLNASSSGGAVGVSGFLDGGGIGGGGGGDGGGTGRWPRQETLTLLEIRSRLDHKFKEANQKGPLWDEVSSAQPQTLTMHKVEVEFYEVQDDLLDSARCNITILKTFEKWLCWLVSIHNHICKRLPADMILQWETTGIRFLIFLTQRVLEERRSDRMSQGNDIPFLCLIVLFNHISLCANINGGGDLGLEKARKKFIKHPKPQDSSTGGEIVKFEADDWERLLMSGEESESKRNLMAQNTEF
ncbi:hypothetical protein F2Q69_00018352 [Brassica cretica]|uniref:Uncharacterized protein n=1 Tax=Brassica cretica TaxID=69181 RepID=A0A8S9PXH0_BRACR|nr:hypothetical protein F2Q69_00018352 [Brassica cretica]